jgi:hypothetical protein
MESKVVCEGGDCYLSLRDKEIKLIKAQFPDLDESVFDKEYTFYYEETNNFRKVSLAVGRDKKTNIDNINSNFVLGGIVLDVNNNDSYGLEELKEKFSLQRTVKEIKFKHICGKGVDFLEALKATKLTSFLQWLVDIGVWIHYSVTNLLYWSLVDIVDSFIDFERWNRQLEMYYSKYLQLKPNPPSILSLEEYLYSAYLLLKDELYKVTLSRLNDVLELLRKYKYPNVDAERLGKFMQDLVDILDIQRKSKQEYPHLSLFFELFSSENEAPFITNQKDNILIDSFSIFYTRNVHLFHKAKHIFDEERSIISELGNYSPIADLKYEFVDSRRDIFIQVSDVIVGLIGRMYDFLSNISYEEIEKISLDEIPHRNLSLLKEIIYSSSKACPAFIHAIMPISVRKKEELLLNKIS